MGEEQPSVYNSPAKIYGEEKDVQNRFAALNDAFTKKYGHPPLFYARAPGRVNIIGEHIDYCGYAVFPMALEQDIVYAVSTNNNGKYKMANTNSNFGDYETDVKSFEITGHQWYDYVLCGHKATIDEAKIDVPVGMNTLVDGTVPKSAGLSSSSALVCCSALTTMYANKKNLSKLTLADASQRCEAYVGTEGGGMDQAISFLAEAGTAKLIEFKPLRATDVRLPDGANFVIANSLREMTKSENAGEYYNKRVSECRIAAQILSNKAGIEWRKTRRLLDTQNAMNKSLDEMVQLVEKTFHKEPYTREEVCKELNITDEELIKECLNPTTASSKEFKLYHRAKHVYSEAARVWKFKQICEENPPDSLKALGELMNASQESCAKDYECSCDELDELTTICRESGALGSRLTGAGWGGCTVSLVTSEVIESFIEKVKSRYFECNEKRREKVKEALFATKPGSGAAIILI
ncbi:N-acetylgalactosamine kinase-like [Hydractinia symbiolongicarpus]|uniref:N-acetylgalactosamine kinase-like n=1 Tax=Hydractinia symbiolongicarpus TaxID=13093 RepID=UPI00254AD80D|nr:N-acetylgalactosamine kinase-like [Hydractinia symbiolongicarpus]